MSQIAQEIAEAIKNLYDVTYPDDGPGTPLPDGFGSGDFVEDDTLTQLIDDELDKWTWKLVKED